MEVIQEEPRLSLSWLPCTVSSFRIPLNGAELVTGSFRFSDAGGYEVRLRLLTLTVIPATQVTTQQPLTKTSKDTIHGLQKGGSNAFLVARRKSAIHLGA